MLRDMESHRHRPRGVRRYRGAEPIGERAQIALLPQIAHELPAGDADVRPLRRDGRRLQAAIEERHGVGAIRERPRPNLQPVILQHA